MEVAIYRDKQIRTKLFAKSKQVQALLGDEEKANKFLATASSVASDYKLRNCNVDSIIDACINIAQMGMDLSPILSHAYLVPFKSQVTIIISARGYTALMARTGWKIKSYIAYHYDTFEYKIEGFKETVTYVKNVDSADAEIRCAVALAESPDGTLFVEIMNKNTIEKHRRVSKDQGNVPSGAWAKWYEEMALKTVIKKMIKKLPIGENMSNAVAMDGEPVEVSPFVDTEEVPKYDELTGEIINEVEVELVDPRKNAHDLLANIDYSAEEGN